MANSSNQVLWFDANYYRNLTDDDLFKDHAIKCRCCFREIQDEIKEENIFEEVHCKSFEEWTNVVMSRNQTSSIHICANCDCLLRAFIEFKKIAGETQKRYSEFLRRASGEIQQQADAEIVDLTTESEVDQRFETDTSRDGRSLPSPGNEGVEQHVIDLRDNHEEDIEEVLPSPVSLVYMVKFSN